MQLYGFQINEQSVSMQRKAYYCKLIADTDQLARQIKYYPLYEEHRTIKGVFENLLKDREVLYAPLFRYVSDELQAHGIYNYDSQRIIDACDAVSGKYISVYMDIQEQCCEIVGALEEEMQLRQLPQRYKGTHWCDWFRRRRLGSWNAESWNTQHCIRCYPFRRECRWKSVLQIVLR